MTVWEAMRVYDLSWQTDTGSQRDLTRAGLDIAAKLSDYASDGLTVEWTTWIE